MLMQALKDYKQIINIHPRHHHNEQVTLTVRLQQIKPQRLFTYEVSKSKKELRQLFNTLTEDIFDFRNPIREGLMGNVGGIQEQEMTDIKEALEECTERLDILTHQSFINFFMLNLHYTDFVSSLQEQEMLLAQATQSEALKADPKLSANWFDKMTKMVQHQQSHLLQVADSTVVDFAYLNHHEQEVVFVLENKKSTKISSFIKSFFSQKEEQCGFLAVHRKVGGKFLQKSRLKLQAEPQHIEYLPKPNLLLVLTGVGIFVYLPRMQRKFQEVQLFGFIQLVGIADYSHNAAVGELYLLENELSQSLQVYSFNKELLMKTQFKMSQPKSICFEEQYQRLYVNDAHAIHVYQIEGFMELKILHKVEAGDSFGRMLIAHGYLYCLNAQQGRLRALELKPPQKQHLMNIAANIELPTGSTALATSPHHKRLLISKHHHSIVLVDTIQGPISAQPQVQRTQIVSLFFNHLNQMVLTVTQDGVLNVHKIVL